MSNLADILARNREWAHDINQRTPDFVASLGLIDNWLLHIQDLRDRHATLLPAGGDLATTVDRLCELNVIEQVRNMCLTTIVRDAW